MNISELSIRRPVLASVLTIIILLFGLIGYSYLGVREFPSVDNPIISVSCSYPGANADVIENQITEPLEQNINGIPGIRSMSSVSSQGQSRITVEFELSVDLETAANDVRDKVSRAQRYLPRDCDPPTVTKADADATPILMVTIQSDKRSLLELSEIADLTVKEQLQTINNVSGVQIWGEKRYSMRLWLDPAKMAGYGITPVDIKNALDRENVELPSGSIEGNTTELTIRTMGLMHTTQEFNDLVVREASNRIIRLSDVGRAELGPQDTRSYMKMNGIPMVGVVVIPQPGANHIDIADAVYQRMETMKKDLPDDVVTSYRATKGAIGTFHALGKQCKEVSGGLPTFISPWIDGKKAVMASGSKLTKEQAVSVEQHEREWDEIFDGIHDVVDACAFQDGHIDYDELDAFFAVNKRLADKYGMQCWTNAESFDRDMPIKFLPIKFDKLRMKLEAARRAGYDKAITFEFSHFMSPQSAYLQAGHLFDRYKEYFNIR